MKRRSPRPYHKKQRIDADDTKWSSKDSFAYTDRRLHGLDRIGQALHVLDDCPCWEHRLDVETALREYDES